MDNHLNANKNVYAYQTPVEEERPAYDFTGDLHKPMVQNNNVSNLRVLTPENVVRRKPIQQLTQIFNKFWPDDNEMQNPVNKLVNSNGKKNEQFKTDLIRDKPRQIDILPEEDAIPFKFSDQFDETPTATRPKSFNDFFNPKK